MNKIKKLFLPFSLLFAFSIIPFGSKVFASDTCWDTFTQEITQCEAMFPQDNPLTDIIEVLCMLADLVTYIVCEIAESIL